MEYIEGLNLSASHIAITKEKIYKNGGDKSVKCRIPILMPNIPDTDPLELKTRLSVSNILNSNKSSIKISDTIVTTNYINITIPEHVLSQLPSSNGWISKGQKIIIIFMNGDINNIQVLGRYI